MIADQKLMTELVIYIRSKGISEYDVEKKRKEILRNVLRHTGKKSLQYIIGADYRLYCDRLCNNVPAKSVKEKVCKSGMTVVMAVGMMYCVRLLDVIMKGDNMFTAPIDISLGYLLSVICILGGVYMAYMLFSKRSAQSHGKMPVSMRIYFGVFFIAIVLISWVSTVYLGAYNLFATPWWLPVIMLVAAYAVFKILYIQYMNNYAELHKK